MVNIAIPLAFMHRPCFHHYLTRITLQTVLFAPGTSHEYLVCSASLKTCYDSVLADVCIFLEFSTTTPTATTTTPGQPKEVTMPPFSTTTPTATTTTPGQWSKEVALPPPSTTTATATITKCPFAHLECPINCQQPLCSGRSGKPLVIKNCKTTIDAEDDWEIVPYSDWVQGSCEDFFAEAGMHARAISMHVQA